MAQKFTVNTNCQSLLTEISIYSCRYAGRRINMHMHDLQDIHDCGQNSIANIGNASPRMELPTGAQAS